MTLSDRVASSGTLCLTHIYNILPTVVVLSRADGLPCPAGWPVLAPYALLIFIISYRVVLFRAGGWPCPAGQPVQAPTALLIIDILPSGAFQGWWMTLSGRAASFGTHCISLIYNILPSGAFQGWWMTLSGRAASSGTHCRTKSPRGSQVRAASTGCITKFHWSSPEKTTDES